MSSAYLYDEVNDRIYVCMSADVWRELRAGWSEPVQVRVESNELTFRSLERVGHVFAAPEVAAVIEGRA